MRNAVSLVLGLGLGLGLVPGFSLPADAATPVRVAPIEHQPVDYVVRSYGVLAPTVEEISFPIAGRIEAFAVQAGDVVTAEQELAHLETRELTDRERSRALQLVSAERELERMRTLFDRGSVQRSMLEDAQSAYDVLAIDLAAAREDLVRSVVRAPAEGIILDRLIDSRTNVAPGEPVFSFQSLAEPWITEVGLTGRNALRIGVGARAAIRFGAHPGRVFEGTLTRLARIADPASGLFVAEITIQPEGADLRPGMVAEVDIRKRSAERYSMLPFDALLEVRDASGVAYLLAPGETRVRRQRVTIHAIDGDRVAVEEDLDAFETVVVRGHDRLQDGTAVELR